ncbi:MAG TPA: SAM-dependent methyltransferase [Pyrinomonadaceae bacterium]|jgi:methyltransferase (TIGR00027 family)
MKENAPSATANVVARNVVLVANRPGFAALVPPEAALLSGWFIADFSEGGRAFVRRATKRWFQALQRVYERLTIPGLALHQALRKRYIEHAVREGLLEGFDQLVVLGGGLDSLAVRLHTEFPEASFIELDHPATQSVKARTLLRRRLIGQNLKLLAVDFTKQGLEETLNACLDYSALRKTIFLAEGVLMYLDASEVDAVFDCVRRQSSSQKRFVFTFMEPDASGKAGFRRSTWLVRLWLRLKGEPFKWGLQGREMESFLTKRGFVLKEMATPATFREIYLREHGLEDAVLAEGEDVCVSDVSG